MKVMCITTQDFTGGQGVYYGRFMEVGDEFTVVGECIGHGRNGVKVPCYDLDKYSHTDQVFDKRNFATLSDQTADDMKEEDHEAIVNIETLNY